MATSAGFGGTETTEPLPPRMGFVAVTVELAGRHCTAWAASAGRAGRR